MKKRADEFLAEAAKTFAERNAVYGDNWKQVGDALQALFPHGVTIKKPGDWNRMHILMLVIVKLTRYANNWEDGGHADSIHDAMVYCGMLEAIDADVNEIEKSKLKIKKVELQKGNLFECCSECDRPLACASANICQNKARSRAKLLIQGVKENDDA